MVLKLRGEGIIDFAGKKWQDVLSFKIKREETLASMSGVTVAVGSKGENRFVAEKREGMLGEHPSSATDVVISDAVPIAYAHLMKVGVFEQEPNDLGKTSPGISTQPDNGDVSANPEHTLQISDFRIKMSENECTIDEVKSDYIKKNELNQLMNVQSASISYGIPDMASTSG